MGILWHWIHVLEKKEDPKSIIWGTWLGSVGRAWDSWSCGCKFVSLNSMLDVEMYYLITTHLGTFFPAVFLFLISSLIPLRSENRHCMISILLNLLRSVLWPRMWSVLVSVPCELEKNVKSAAIIWNSLQMSMIASWSMVLLSSLMSLLIFYCTIRSFLREVC